MWMTSYIAAVKRGLRDQHGFTPTGGADEEPLFTNVPDGEYPIEINGRMDQVRVEGDKLHVCNFDPAPEETLKQPPTTRHPEEES